MQLNIKATAFRQAGIRWGRHVPAPLVCTPYHVGCKWTDLHLGFLEGVLETQQLKGC